MSLYHCQYGQHERSYGAHDLFAPAKVLVRETCPHCDHFRVVQWCELCWSGVQNSGRFWRCDQCENRLNPDDKLKFIQRIGDV